MSHPINLKALTKVGKVTHVFSQKRCVAILPKVRLHRGDDILFFYPENKMKEIPEFELRLRIESLHINREPVVIVDPQRECAVHVPYGVLPPNNAEVYLIPSPITMRVWR